MDKKPRSNILVTGATGFVGSALVKLLCDDEYTVTAMVRVSSDNSPVFENESINVIEGDLLDAESMEAACHNQQVVVHLAGKAHVNADNTALSRATIVDGTKNILNAAIKQKVCRFVYLSSSLAHTVNHGSGDDTAYGQSKREAESLLYDAQSKGLIEVVILRPVNVYGMGMRGNIAGMISRIARNRLPPLPALSSRISLVSVTDLTLAIRLVITAVEAKGKTYTVTDGQEYKILEIEKAIYTALGKRIPGWRTPRVILFAAALMAEIYSQFRRNGSSIGLRTYRNITHDNLFENSAICDELGFQPSTTFYKELPRIVANISQKPQNR